MTFSIRVNLTVGEVVSALQAGGGRLPVNEIVPLVLEPSSNDSVRAGPLARSINDHFNSVVVRATDPPLSLIELCASSDLLAEIAALSGQIDPVKPDVLGTLDFVNILREVGSLRYFIDRGPAQTPVGLVYQARDLMSDALLRMNGGRHPLYLALPGRPAALSEWLSLLVPWELGLDFDSGNSSEGVTHLVRVATERPCGLLSGVERLIIIDRMGSTSIESFYRENERQVCHAVAVEYGRKFEVRRPEDVASGDARGDGSLAWVHVIDHLSISDRPSTVDLEELALRENIAGYSLSHCFGGTALLGAEFSSAGAVLCARTRKPVVCFDGQVESISSLSAFSESFYRSLFVAGLFRAVAEARRRLASGFLGGFPTWSQLQLYL